jgi:hypothetical protein
VRRRTSDDLLHGQKKTPTLSGGCVLGGTSLVRRGKRRLLSPAQVFESLLNTPRFLFPLRPLLTLRVYPISEWDTEND